MPIYSTSFDDGICTSVFRNKQRNKETHRQNASLAVSTNGGKNWIGAWSPFGCYLSGQTKNHPRKTGVGGAWSIQSPAYTAEFNDSSTVGFAYASPAGAVLRWGREGGTGPPNVGQAPQIFWFQQQKYVFLKSRLFLYSGEINTRIN